MQGAHQKPWRPEDGEVQFQIKENQENWSAVNLYCQKY